MALINGTAASDLLEGTTLADTITGGAGDDTIWGGEYGSDLLDGGDGNDYLVADSGPNILLGGAGNDYLQGGSDNDKLNGGSGNDTLDGGDFGWDTADYSGTTTAIKVDLNIGTEQNTLGAGTDKLISIERVLGGAGNDTLIGWADDNSSLEGNAGNDSLVGGNADDYLFGGAGNDTLIGGTGSDRADYFGTAAVNVDLGTTVAQNTIGAGTDLLSGIENVSGGLGNDTLVGSSGNNELWGDAGADSITGGTGNDTLGGGIDSVADTLIGGTGDDLYLVNSANDVITELASQGTDVVESTATSYTMAINIENAHLANGGVNLTGNILNNIIEGNNTNNQLSGADGNDELIGGKGADTLSGGNGNDTLDGGIGSDSMAGSAGDDFYYVNTTTDIVTEAVGLGTDTVNSYTTSYTLSANVENLTLLSNYYDNSANYSAPTISYSAVNGTGNELNNKITGNELANQLIGMAGNDTLIGDNGDDTLQGGAGNDVLNGGYDTDIAIYTDATAGVKVSLATTAAQVTGGSGTDTLISIEDLLGSSFNDTLTGSADNNYINDGAGNDAVTAGAGDDDLYASAGNDTIDGGSDNDTFIFADATTASKLDLSLTIAQNTLSSGTDIVTNIENIVGSNFNDSLTGNSSDNEFWGGNGNDTINGGAGNDTLDGEGGTDSLIGGLGDDVYYVSGSDVIVENASAGNDTVIADANFTLATNFENLYLSTPNNIFTTSTTGENAEEVVTRYGTGSALTGTGNASDNLIVGNYNNNTLTGLAGNDTLDGVSGADTLIGGTGNDTYIVDSTSDIVTEAAAEGTDTIETSLSSYTLGANVENLTFFGSSQYDSSTHIGTGNELNNVLEGAAGADTLNGGAGNDTLNGGDSIDQLSGGLGDDVYEIAYNQSGYYGSYISGFDQITEASAAGTDTVKLVTGDYLPYGTGYTLGANIENLISYVSEGMQLTGNALNNNISSSSGSDTIDGSAGADTMAGGLGNDNYYVDNIGDVVTEIADSTQSLWNGDTVNSAISFILGANIEKLTLTGTSAINGTGNALSNTVTGNSAANNLNGGDGDDYLDGGAGNDTLIGGTGGDTMTGGAGNDTYYIDSFSDYITENLNAGTDSVIASFATAGQYYNLGDNIENIALSGSLTANATGNSLANVITGNGAANSLSGDNGADTLAGAAGNDTLDGGSGNDMLKGDAGSDSIELASSSTWNAGGYGSDTVILNSLTGADSITGFDDVYYSGETLATGADKLQISMLGIKIGDGDTLVESAATVSSTATTFAKGAELVIFGDTLDYSGISNAATVSAAIGSADAAYVIGDTRLFVVQTGTGDYDSSAIWQFKAADADAVVESNEITLIATVDAATQLADYSFVA